uniref:Uncharacterized protein n=1 Tax=Octopus bimaculoides TaxID=37653 RepID=A0A0L8FKL9_OCTBM
MPTRDLPLCIPIHIDLSEFTFAWELHVTLQSHFLYISISFPTYFNLISYTCFMLYRW